jgi:hypothetical protein
VQAYDTAAYKCAADELILDAGVRPRLHTLAVGAVAAGSRLRALLVETKSGRQAVAGSVFVDCSGDADLAAWAGAPWAKGDGRGWLQYPTMMFRLGGVDTERAQREGVPRLRNAMLEAQQRREYHFPRLSPILRPQAHPGEWRANMTQVSRDVAPVDGTNVDDLTYAEIEGRRQVVSYARFVRKHVPGFESSYIQELPAQVGIRETRRLLGRHVLTGEEVLSGATFPDTIGLNGWPIEKHILGGTEWRWIDPPGYHAIPYRALLPAGGAENLLVAGRCASATQDAQASIRVTGPCYAMGQAAGTAAALAAQRGTPVAALDITQLQAELRRQRALLG